MGRHANRRRFRRIAGRLLGVTRGAFHPNQPRPFPSPLGAFHFPPAPYFPASCSTAATRSPAPPPPPSPRSRLRTRRRSPRCASSSTTAPPSWRKRSPPWRSCLLSPMTAASAGSTSRASATPVFSRPSARNTNCIPSPSRTRSTPASGRSSSPTKSISSSSRRWSIATPSCKWSASRSAFFSAAISSLPFRKRSARMSLSLSASASALAAATFGNSARTTSATRC